MADIPAEAINSFRALLADTIGQLEEFVRLLDKERKLLEAADAEALLSLAADKSAAIQRLQRSENARALALARHGVDNSRTAIDSLIAGPAKAAESAWQHYLRLVERVRDMNRDNGILVREQMSFNQKALGALLAASETGLYDAGGLATGRPGGRHLGSV
ncbi:flagellar protein FlgN [Niveibacterium sp. SC-1]|uniref:flagella synthesis protein FlgN n=1 Tax=Niveibacterium sp. SC-1 TaxID=3135646 RepID=UPI00311FAAE8